MFRLLLKKKQLDKSLLDTEHSIYDFETSYFESSGHDGNIVHGFEGYLSSRTDRNRSQQHYTDADRIFSNSSATFKRAQEARIANSLLDSEDESESEGEYRMGRTIRHGGRKKAGRQAAATTTTIDRSI